ncbi:hypothetical protein CWI36_0311p0020 [Hamiltosporidium magnivora]|uniref:Uncharacterized protein n=1 Tax=Hamiltosporidium magnivora TaxID=148818 RepID=A0A4Q9LI57_9MICR|nr:hypothetical protein CWI36_0311p0020 [Hamiltosporidium magnivora]
MFVLNKSRDEITIIQEEITYQDSLQKVLKQNLKHYYLLANDSGLIYMYSLETIYILEECDRNMIKYYKKYWNIQQLHISVKACFSSIISRRLSNPFTWIYGDDLNYSRY